jgi:hypothetical protein
MTDSERQQILKMIADGKITADEGLKLMQALDETPLEDEPAALPDADSDAGNVSIVEPVGEADGEKEKREAFFARRINRFRSLWTIPLVFGILLTVTSAYWMYSALESAGLGFWFYCSWLPFALGVLAIALGFSSRESRWLYVDVRQKPDKTPGRIVISFPMSIVTGLVSTFGGYIPENERLKTNMVMDAFQKSVTSDAPILVDVDGKNGEHVQIYIG